MRGVFESIDRPERVSRNRDGWTRPVTGRTPHRHFSGILTRSLIWHRACLNGRHEAMAVSMDPRCGAGAGRLRAGQRPVPASRARRRRLAAGRGSAFGAGPGSRAGTVTRARDFIQRRPRLGAGPGPRRVDGQRLLGRQPIDGDPAGAAATCRKRARLTARTSPPRPRRTAITVTTATAGSSPAATRGGPAATTAATTRTTRGSAGIRRTTRPAPATPAATKGALRLKVKPVEASVYVDGYYVGVVDDFDGVFQRLRLEPGPHHLEIRAAGTRRRCRST